MNSPEEQGIETCTTCPSLCRWVCPVAEAECRETVSPHALVVLGGFLKRGIAPVEAVGPLPFHCTHCGACTEVCLHKNDVPMLLGYARSRVLAGHSAPSAVNELRGNFGVAGNPQGAALDGILARATSEADVDLARAGEVVYFPGCETLGSLPEAATAFLRATLLFGISGVSVTPASAACCGLALLWSGDLDGFRAHAERFSAQVSDVKRLVVHDPACAEALKRRYREISIRLAPEVHHVSEFLDEKLDALGARGGQGATGARVAYADVCSLSRGLGVVGAPRRLLAKASEHALVDLEGAAGRDCCGASGLLPLTAPQTARAMAEVRIHGFRESGATELAVFSPRCAAHLKSVDPALPVVDGAMVLARL